MPTSDKAQPKFYDNTLVNNKFTSINDGSWNLDYGLDMGELTISVNLAWQCPGCLTYYAPWISCCNCQRRITTSANTTFSINTK